MLACSGQCVWNAADCSRPAWRRQCERAGCYELACPFLGYSTEPTECLLENLQLLALGGRSANAQRLRRRIWDVNRLI